MNNPMEISRLVNELKDYLLSSQIKNNIAKIVLFGSHAKGVPSQDSDIDIMIFTTDGDDIEKNLWIEYMTL